ncbi:MAG: ribulose-phosphate 3-epimerase [Armatimonadota bacterium]|jgi:ribulose-phosphate 3-epimerase|nr:ribulose-phosphate 3-epimerase [Fimbriimonadales bacterium]
MKYELAPSVLSFDLTSLSSSVPRLIAAGAGIVHLDVMDGQFVPPITFGAALASSLRKHTDAPMEAHLMVMDPERQFDAFQEAGCKRIVFHYEATKHAHRLVQDLKSRGLDAGIAINPGTPSEVLDAVIGDLDMVLVMTVNPGWGGQKFIASTLEKIARVRALRPDMDIQVDGGIDPSTIGQVIEAGANSFVVGSYLLKPPTLEEGVKSILEKFPLS